MKFDPFGDFKTRGYLRNYAQEKDRKIVSDLEHRSFKANIKRALQRLAVSTFLTYTNVLDTHKILFEAVYPWAGQDRLTTAPDIAVRRGSVHFAHPKSAKQAIDYALKLGQDAELMAKKPGTVMSYLAYGHPFLEGNGRTILTVHTELAQRAEIGIDWSATKKTDYLSALTGDLQRPENGILDNYLAPFIRPAGSRSRLANRVAKIPGLEGGDFFPDVEYGQYSKMEGPKSDPPKPR